MNKQHAIVEREPLPVGGTRNAEFPMALNALLGDRAAIVKAGAHAVLGVKNVIKAEEVVFDGIKIPGRRYLSHPQRVLTAVKSQQCMKYWHGKHSSSTVNMGNSDFPVKSGVRPFENYE